MVTSTLLPSRIGVRVGEYVFDAVPVLLRGDRASFKMEHVPQGERIALIVDWSDGRVTELGARVRHVDRECSVAHVDVLRVEGDWRPFLEYLGSSGE